MELIEIADLNCKILQNEQKFSSAQKVNNSMQNKLTTTKLNIQLLVSV